MGNIEVESMYQRLEGLSSDLHFETIESYNVARKLAARAYYSGFGDGYEQGWDLAHKDEGEIKNG